MSDEYNNFYDNRMNNQERNSDPVEPEQPADRTPESSSAEQTCGADRTFEYSSADTAQNTGSTYHYGREVNSFGTSATADRAENENASYYGGTGTAGNQQYGSYTGASSGNTQYSSYSQAGNSSNASAPYTPYPYAASGTGSFTDSRNEKKQKKRRTHEKKQHRTLKVAALIIVCSLLSGTVGAAVMGFAGNSSLLSGSSKTEITTSTHQSTAVEVKSVDSETVMTAAEVYAANVNATVGITTSITTNYFGWTTSSAASGSGFIISQDGYIVTNYHVIEDNDSITVTTYDDTKYTATVVGCDKTNDIAVIKIDATGLSTVKIGNSDNTNVGDDVVAIGNPLGELTFSLTKGTISALNRDITIETGYTMKLIQTDCAINSGNSGGALFNMYGEVIGITNAKYSSSSSSASIDNIGFAIPISSVYDIIKGIIETGTVTRNTIGVTLTDLSNINRFYANYSGAVITAVESGSSAESAGLQAGDIITELNGEAISDADSLDAAIRSADAGTVLTLTVYRSSEKMTVDVTVTSAQISATADTETEENTQTGYSGNYQFF